MLRVGCSTTLFENIGQAIGDFIKSTANQRPVLKTNLKPEARSLLASLFLLGVPRIYISNAG